MITLPQGVGGDLPATLQTLPNGRYRLTRRFQRQSAAQIKDGVLLALGTALSTVYTTDADETKFTDLKLIEQACQPAKEDTPGAGYVITQVFETLTSTFAQEVDDVVDYDFNGLKRVTRVLVAQAGTSTSAYVVGTQSFGSTPTLYLAKVQIEDGDSMVRIRAEYLEPGITSRETRLLDGGIKQTTLRAFYTEPTISNAIVVSRTQENEEGYPVWQIVGLTKIDGTSLTSAGAALSLDTQAPFTYPGRAKPYKETATVNALGVSGSWDFVDVYLSPPTDITVDATTEVSYATSNDIGTLPYTLWNPDEWAVLSAYWYNANDQFRQRIEGLRGYRAVGSTQSGTSSDPSRTSVLGEWMGYGSSYVVKVSGGPSAPDTNTYVLRYSVDPAFVSVSGTQYYRRTITYATIPAQSSLPV